MDWASEIAAWVAVGFLAALGVVIILLILRGKDGGIDLQRLVSEDDGKASMSRFQFLIFTFVIGTGVLISVLENGRFPDVGSDIFGLLGISAAGYVGSKMAQKTARPPPEPGDG
jgi:hypothetical protein